MKRRHFLMGALALSPLAILRGGLDGVLNLFSRGFAGQRPPLKTYVMLNLYGAPTRWLYDNCLKPTADHKVVGDRVLYTNYVAGAGDHYDPVASDVQYSTVPYGDQLMPHLWGSKIYFRGRLVPMTQLLPHMLTVRGVWQGINSHPVGNVKQICVRNGDTSISGLVADSSRRPIPAISLGGSPAGNAYKSETGVAQLDVAYENSSPDSNLIHYLTRSFTGEELNLPKDFDAIAEYDKLVDKYSRIISKTRARCPIAGLTDKPYKVKEFSAPTHEELITVLNRFKTDGDFVLHHDYTSVFADLRVGAGRFIEKQFALAEFLLLNKLSSSIVLSPPRGGEMAISNLKTSQMFTLADLKIVQRDGRYIAEVPKGGEERTIAVKMDNHGGGSFFAMVGHSIFFQCYSACLLELVQTLKDHSHPHDDLFSDTVIHLATEFDRSVPKVDGNSNHFAGANPVSLISGMVSEYKLIGNIRVQSPSPGNDCTFGEAAPVAEHKGELVRTEHILSSITTVLGGRRLSFRHPSILAVKDGRIVTHFKQPKNLDV